MICQLNEDFSLTKFCLEIKLNATPQGLDEGSVFGPEKLIQTINPYVDRSCVDK